MNRDQTSRRVGWWGVGPLLFGMGFTVLGVLFLVFSDEAGPGSSGLVTSGIVFLLIGIPALVLAWWIRRDITSDDETVTATPEPSEMDARQDAELRVTGVRGSARVKGFKYLVSARHDRGAPVELDLEITTTLGGTVDLKHRTRVPLAVTDKLSAGSTVPVIVSSTDPSKLIVEWTGLVAAAG